jgi:hypothetical protein
LNPERLLELLYLTAQRRLGDVQSLRRAREIAFVGNRYEISKMSQLHLNTYWI